MQQELVYAKYFAPISEHSITLLRVNIFQNHQQLKFPAVLILFNERESERNKGTD